MKKVFIVIIIVGLVSAISISCKKSCVCYTKNSGRYLYDIPTKQECNEWAKTQASDTTFVRCEWEKF